MALALGLLIVAGYYGIERPGLRITGGVLAGVLVVLTVLYCYGDALLLSAFEDGGGQTVASSPRYAVVRYARPVLLGTDTVVRYVRARRSLLTYESDTAIAASWTRGRTPGRSSSWIEPA